MRLWATLILLIINALVVSAQNYPLVQGTIFFTAYRTADIRANGGKFWSDKPSTGTNMAGTIPIEVIRTMFFTPANDSLSLAADQYLQGQPCYIASNGAFSFQRGKKIPAGGKDKGFNTYAFGTALRFKNSSEQLYPYACAVGTKSTYHQIFFYPNGSTTAPKTCKQVAIGINPAKGAATALLVGRA